MDVVLHLRKINIYSKLLLVCLIIKSLRCSDEWPVPGEEHDEKVA